MLDRTSTYNVKFKGDISVQQAKALVKVALREAGMLQSLAKMPLTGETNNTRRVLQLQSGEILNIEKVHNHFNILITTPETSKNDVLTEKEHKQNIIWFNIVPTYVDGDGWPIHAHALVEYDLTFGNVLSTYVYFDYALAVSQSPAKNYKVQFISKGNILMYQSPALRVMDIDQNGSMIVLSSTATPNPPPPVGRIRFGVMYHNGFTIPQQYPVSLCQHSAIAVAETAGFIFAIRGMHYLNYSISADDIDYQSSVVQIVKHSLTAPYAMLSELLLETYVGRDTDINGPRYSDIVCNESRLLCYYRLYDQILGTTSHKIKLYDFDLTEVYSDSYSAGYDTVYAGHQHAICAVKNGFYVLHGGTSNLKYISNSGIVTNYGQVMTAQRIADRVDQALVIANNVLVQLIRYSWPGTSAGGDTVVIEFYGYTFVDGVAVAHYMGETSVTGSTTQKSNTSISRYHFFARPNPKL